MKAEPDSDRRTTGSATGAQILLVDDDPGAVAMLADALRAHGYQPVTTTDPREALALLAMERFDLVIADIVMPYLDGFGLLEKARERNPGAEVLLISGFATGEIVREALRKGAAAVLPKPFDVATFAAQVRALLDRPSVS